MGVTNENDAKFNEFLDVYQQKEAEILAARMLVHKEYEDIQDLDGKQEYLEIDANRYRLYYFGWALGSVVLVLLSSKLFK